MKYDKHHIDIIIKALSEGEGRVRACKAANICYDTFLEWMEQKSEFLEAVKKAEMTGNDKIKDLQKRKIIDSPQWQSGAWWLERKYPEEFGLRQNLIHEGIPQNITFKVTKPENLKKLKKLLKQQDVNGSKNGNMSQ